MAKNNRVTSNGFMRWGEPDGYGRRLAERTGLPIYDSFPEFVVDNWSEETRAKGCTKRQNTYLIDTRKACTGGMYSDRMWQWDADKMERACKLMKGWHNSSQAEYNAMLCEYLGKQVAVTQVIQMQDGRGFDLYYIAFYEPKSPTPINQETTSHPTR